MANTNANADMPKSPSVGRGDLIHTDQRNYLGDDGVRMLMAYCPACAESHLLSLHALGLHVGDDEYCQADYSCPAVASSDISVYLFDDEFEAVCQQIAKEIER